METPLLRSGSRPSTNTSKRNEYPKIKAHGKKVFVSIKWHQSNAAEGEAGPSKRLPPFPNHLNPPTQVTHGGDPR